MRRTITIFRPTGPIVEAMNRGGGRQNYGRGQGRGRGRGGRGGGYNHRGRGGRHHNQNNRNNNRENVSNYVHNIGTTGNPSSTSFTVAVQGCSHGELDSIYDALESYRGQKLTTNDPSSAPSKNIDVLLCCGDVQTLRNTADFHSLNVPPKYKAMGDFHAYYSGQKVAPILTIMIGGNHESSNYLQELHYGGWVAPNMYYLGAAGVINLCKRTTAKDASSTISTLRIGGISGIYNSKHYSVGRFEMPPYNQGELRSVYHTRQVEVKRLQALASSTANQQETIDVMISHDWPRGIYYHGNIPQLIQRKPFFRKEIEDNDLGSPANEALLHTLKPKYWFAAHLHVKFEALVRHGSKSSESAITSDPKSELMTATEPQGKKEESTEPVDTGTTEFQGMESNDGICPDTGSSNMETLTDQMTRFLSLDKCLPKRRHIQITHLEPSSSRSVNNDAEPTSPVGDNDNKAWLEYDASWLASLRRTHGWTQRTRRVVVAEDQNPITKAEIEDVLNIFEGGNANGSPKSNPLAIPQNFAMTVPPFDPSSTHRSYGPPQGSPMIGNPQTDHFLETLGLDHRITVPFTGAMQQQPPLFVRQPPPSPLIPSAVIRGRSNGNIPSHSLDDENEIDLDDDQDEMEGSENAASSEVQKMVEENKDNSCLDDTLDPAEIDLEESEEEGVSAAKDDTCGDTVCFSPPSSVAKKPRTD